MNRELVANLLTRDDRLPRYLKLRDHLLAHIVAQEWCAGDAIPPEVDLVKQYARRLRVEPGMPVVVIEGLALGYHAHPLEWRRSRGPADQFNYCVDVR